MAKAFLADPQIRKRASVVCLDQGKLLTILLKDPSTHIENYFVPGGAIESGETPAQAAYRETLEETGYLVKLVPGSEAVTEYDFTWNSKVFHCITHWFKASLFDPAEAPRKVDDAPYHRGVFWLDLAQVPERFDFHEPICTQVLKMLKLNT